MEMKGTPSFLSMIMRRSAIKRPLTSELRVADWLLEAQTVGIGQPAKTFDQPPSFKFVIGDRGNSETASVIDSDIDAPPSYTDVVRRDASEIASVDQNLPEVLDFEDVSGASDSTDGKRRGATRNDSTHMRKPGSIKFTMAEIHKATKNFSPALKVGQGGFGTVYKGQLQDGTLVAIKRAEKSMYDNNLEGEFQSEIQALSTVEHLNLVKCYGYLEQGDERLVVVEYVPNRTLREHLECFNGNVLSLASRLNIVIDVAHAITYLHTYTDRPIIHRDIKSSNILLTEKLRAKVADFGFALLAADAESGQTHVLTKVKGTVGYLDPEYMRTYELTEKSDVYSFGILLVELVTGRRPIEVKREPKERITARWAMKKFTDGDAISILDPRLEKSDANGSALEKILELALQCVASHRQNRPIMKRCAEVLWNIRKDYNEVFV